MTPNPTVNVIINGLDETKEEIPGAFVGYFPDDIDGQLTSQGIEGFSRVSITCLPQQPASAMVSVDAPTGFLYEKVGEEYVPAKTLYPANEIGGIKFFLHGHILSGSLRDRHIAATLLNSTASDLANFTVFEVQLEKCDAAWKPQGGINYLDGNITTIKAFVTPNAVMGGFKFTLFGVSHEKGYCMNAPKNVPESGFHSDEWRDLQFEWTEPYIISGENCDVAETVATYISYEAIVSIRSFDYGSYGKIKVEFTCQDGSFTCKGREEGGTAEFTNLPRDENNNFIQDAAPQNSGPGPSIGVSDDLDMQPSGKPGDGFSRYEEWRGFIVNESHKRTDVIIRDLFVQDFSGLGSGDYASASRGIEVHLIKENEWSGWGLKIDDMRIINFNQGTGFLSKQYGVQIFDGKRNGYLAGYCFGDPNGIPCGPPNTCLYVAIYTDWISERYPDNTIEKRNYLIAHELGHATALDNHTLQSGGCPMINITSEMIWGAPFCINNVNCQSKLDVKDP